MCIGITPKVTEGLEYVLEGKATPTVKIDGSCCAIRDGELYKRYDVKGKRKAPKGAIPCGAPDAITGHHPHWVKCDRNNPDDKWFFNAFDNTPEAEYQLCFTRTFEAIGPHFQGNPYGLSDDILEPHGVKIIEDMTDFSFEGIKQYLKEHYIEGIVFWYEGFPRCKIKRSDFGFEWNGR